MQDNRISIAVVIPTLGRPALAFAVQSALAQTYPPDEVIVVDASKEGTAKDFIDDRSRVTIIRPEALSNSGLWTAAHNRNIGIQYSTSDYIALLDDDDEWLPRKLETQVQYIERYPNSIVSCAAKYRLQNGLSYSRPRRCLKPSQNILEALYGKSRLLPLPYYIATPSLLVPAIGAKSIPINEELPGFEDTWWLHKLQCAGYKIHQLKETLIVVNAEPLRSISRDSLEKNNAWAKTIGTVKSKYAINYLLGLSMRNATTLGRTSDIRFLYTAAGQIDKINPILKLRTSFFLMISFVIHRSRVGRT